LVSTYAPRRHDLAGPAADLARELAADCEVRVCAVDRHGLEYPDEVVSVIAEDDLADYRRAARILAEYGVDAVVIEYDDGVFGGPAGSHVLDLAHELRLRGVEYLVRLHSLGPPTGPESRVVAALSAGAGAVVVPTAHAAALVRSRRLGPDSGTVVVAPPAVVMTGVGPPMAARPDAVPFPGRAPTTVPFPGRAPTTVPFPGRAPTTVPSTTVSLGAAWSRASTAGPVMTGAAPPVSRRPSLATALQADPGRLLTVLGRIAPGHGLEQALHDYAKVAADHPDVRLVIAETAYPEASERVDGYAAALWELAHELGVAGRLAIVEERLARTERAMVLDRTEILLVPSLPADRPTFPVIGEALVAGCPVVSVPHPYAMEVLGTGAGVVARDDSECLSRDLSWLLGDAVAMAGARAEAAVTGWRFAPTVVADQIRDAARRVAGGVWPPAAVGDVPASTTAVFGPAIVVPARLEDLHAEAAGPEDHARLALVARRLAGAGAGAAPVAVDDWKVCAEWSRRAVTGLAGTSDLTGLDPRATGWVVRGLAALTGPGLPPAGRHRAFALLATLNPAVERCLSGDGLDQIDCAAQIVLAGADARDDRSFRPALDRLLGARATSHRGRSWPWFAGHLARSAARLPHALIVGGSLAGDQEIVAKGVESLGWYLRRVGLGDIAGVLAVPMPPGGEAAEDAAAVVEALVDAYRVTGSARYARLAVRAFAWFAGINRHDEPAYDPDLGRCRDRIGPVLERYSARATLAYLSAAASLRAADLVRLDATGSVRQDLAAAA
jgi:glycosyltransferase involved in cell wall biosynthesis